MTIGTSTDAESSDDGLQKSQAPSGGSSAWRTTGMLFADRGAAERLKRANDTISQLSATELTALFRGRGVSRQQSREISEILSKQYKHRCSIHAMDYPESCTKFEEKYPHDERSRMDPSKLYNEYARPLYIMATEVVNRGGEENDELILEMDKEADAYYQTTQAQTQTGRQQSSNNLTKWTEDLKKITGDWGDWGPREEVKDEAYWSRQLLLVELEQDPSTNDEMTGLDLSGTS